MEPTTFLVSVLGLLALLLGYFVILRATPKDKNPVVTRSPPALPIIGHLHYLKSKQPLHRTLYDLALEFGPVIPLSFGSRSALVVSSLSVAEECFTVNDVVLANRPWFLLGEHLLYGNSTVNACPYGDHWRNLRRISHVEMFSTNRLDVALSVAKDEVCRLVQMLSSNAADGYARVEMRPVLMELVFNVMMRMVAGKRYYGEDARDDEEARKFRRLIKEVTSVAGASNPSDFLPILRWIDYSGFKKKVVRLSRDADSFLQGLIDEHQHKKGSCPEFKDTTIDHMLDLQRSEPEEYPDCIIKGQVLVMIIAGTDTTSQTMEWALSNLLNNPETLDRTKAEIDAQIGREQLMDESNVSKLTYLQNVIYETLRLNTVTPLLVPHESSHDCTVGGYKIPRGTMLLVNAWAIHKDPALWKDPFAFLPKRFEDKKNAHKLIMPFGMGRRACPGSALAQRVMGLMLGMLIQCFDWERVSTEKIDMAEGRGSIMPKLVPLEAKCRARPVVYKFLNRTLGHDKKNTSSTIVKKMFNREM